MNHRDPLLWILAGTFLVSIAAAAVWSQTNAAATYRAKQLAAGQMRNTGP